MSLFTSKVQTKPVDCCHTPMGMATIKTQAHFWKDMGQAELRHDGGRHKGDKHFTFRQFLIKLAICLVNDPAILLSIQEKCQHMIP